MNRKFRLNNFDVIKINAVVGCYDDIYNKEKQIIDNKKYFSKFKVEMDIQPKYPKSYIISNDDYDIGELYKRHSGHVSISPFVKNDKLYYEVKDCQSLSVYCFYEFGEQYEYKDGNKKLRELIKNKQIPYWTADNKEKIESVFIHSKHFNYTNDIEWIAD